jgi:hypothetical protein
VAPARGQTGTVAPVEDPIWTRDAIAKLYRDKQEGKISAADFAKAEAQIFKQARENKIAA